jgi:hypothetical protein
MIKTPVNSNQRTSNTVDEVNYHCKKKSSKLHIKYYPSDPEVREIIKSIGDAACLLFQYYCRMAAIGESCITDATIAQQFGWKEQKAKRNRLALTKAGWFRMANSRLSDGRKGISYYIGKEAVYESLTNPKPIKP